MSEIAAALERVYRRVLMTVGRARVTTVDDTGPAQKLQAKLNQLELPSDILRLAEFGFASNPPAGSDIVVLFLGGNRTDAIGVATSHQTLRMKNLAPGESAQYSEIGQYVYLSAAGIVVEAKGLPVTVNDATTVTINASGDVIMNTPLLKVSGDIIDNYGSNAHTMAQMRSIYDSHDHGNVQNGGGNTSGPSASM